MKYLAAAAFVGTVYLANWLLTTYGIVQFLGMSVPCGVFAAGLGFLLRDVVHELAGRWWVIGCIMAGAALSYWLGASVNLGGSVTLAVASGVAFAASELADLSVYAPLRERHLFAAVGASQVVGAAADSAIFLSLAFGSVAFFWSQTLMKTLMVLPALGLLAAWRYRARLVPA